MSDKRAGWLFGADSLIVPFTVERRSASWTAPVMSRLQRRGVARSGRAAPAEGGPRVILDEGATTPDGDADD